MNKCDVGEHHQLEPYCHKWTEYARPYKKCYKLNCCLLYSQQGFKEEIKYADEYGNISASELKFSYDYLSVPVKLGYTRGDQLKGFVKMGLCPSVLLKAQVRVPKDDINLVGYEVINFYNKVPKFDLGGLIEFGAAYELKNDLELFSSFTYRKSFTTISTVEHFGGAQMKHYLFSMAIGLKYKLNVN